MSFPHAMNLVANIWHVPFAIPPGNPPDLVTPCCLQQMHSQVPLPWDGANIQRPTAYRYIYFPKGTDVRYEPATLIEDLIELPQGSGTYYQTVDVQDWNKGTPNEERRATVYWAAQAIFPMA